MLWWTALTNNDNVDVLDVRELKEKRISECLPEPLGCVPATKSRTEMDCQTLENNTIQRNFDEHNVVETNECQSMESQVDVDKTTTLAGELSIGETNL